MKKVCLIFDHPYTADACHNEPHNRSFSAALLKEVKEVYEEKSYDSDVIDLHKDGFNPVMHKEDLLAWRKKTVADPLVKNYQERILLADELVFIFPIWWEVMPAMTKGFFDKVLSKGIVYEEPKPGSLFTHNFEKLKSVKLMTVMATPNIIYRLIFGNPLTKVVFRGTFRKMGFGKLKWYNYAGVQKLTLEERQQLLTGVGKKLSKSIN